MTEFGMATVFGSIPFCVALVPAIAYTANFGCCRKRPDASVEQKESDKVFMKLVARDMFFIIVSLALFYSFMGKSSITIGEAYSLLVLFIIYVILVYT